MDPVKPDAGPVCDQNTGKARSDRVFFFLKRFLDMSHNRFGVGFRYRGALAALINRPPAISLGLAWKPGLKFSFDAIPSSIAHHFPLGFLISGAGYGSRTV